MLLRFACWYQLLKHVTFVVQKGEAGRSLCGDLHHDALSAAGIHQSYTGVAIVSPPHTDASIASTHSKAGEAIGLVVHTGELDNLIGAVLADSVNGERMLFPNDLAIAADTTVWVLRRVAP